LLEIDIHPYVKGVKFEDVWKHKVNAKMGKVKTHFASLDDLIKMKKAAGRPKDREDLKILLQLKKKRRK
jgi:predicted nucleotidyltransferase